MGAGALPEALARAARHRRAVELTREGNEVLGHAVLIVHMELDRELISDVVLCSRYTQGLEGLEQRGAA